MAVTLDAGDRSPAFTLNDQDGEAVLKTSREARGGSLGARPSPQADYRSSGRRRWVGKRSMASFTRSVRCGSPTGTRINSSAKTISPS